MYRGYREKMMPCGARRILFLSRCGYSRSTWRCWQYRNNVPKTCRRVSSRICVRVIILVIWNIGIVVWRRSECYSAVIIQCVVYTRYLVLRCDETVYYSGVSKAYYYTVVVCRQRRSTTYVCWPYYSGGGDENMLGNKYCYSIGILLHRLQQTHSRECNNNADTIQQPAIYNRNTVATTFIQVLLL